MPKSFFDFEKSVAEAIRVLGMDEEEAKEFTETARQLSKGDDYTQAIEFIDLYVEKLGIGPEKLAEQFINEVHAQEERERDRSARTIQAVARGFLSRRRTALNRLIEEVIAELQLSEELADTLHSEAALVLLEKNHEAATQWVQEQLEQGRQRQKEEQAAITLQSTFRRVLAQKALHEEKERRDKQRDAAVKLQSLIRAYAERKTFVEVQDLVRRQRGAMQDIEQPTLQLTSGLALEGAKVLQWFEEVIQQELIAFYDDSRVVIPKTYNPLKLTLDASNWLETWAHLRWKDILVARARPHFHQCYVDNAKNPHAPKWGGLRYNDYGPLLVTTGRKISYQKALYDIYLPFGLIGDVTMGGTEYSVEEKAWIKAKGVVKAPRYNELGDALALTRSAQTRAANIRKVLKGNFTGVDTHEREAALAIFGAEVSRNPRSWGIGLMLLDLVENQVPYGRNQNKHYTWDALLGSTKHGGESDKDYSLRKTGGTGLGSVRANQKKQRWDRFELALTNQSPEKFWSFPVEAKWAGKWSMSPSASMSLGKTAVPSRTQELNSVQYKELKTLLRWFVFMTPTLKLQAKNEGEAKLLLQKLFRTRITSTDKFTRASLESTWT